VSEGTASSQVSPLSLSCALPPYPPHLISLTCLPLPYPVALQPQGSPKPLLFVPVSSHFLH
jgi:hypothetical protein